MLACCRRPREHFMVILLLDTGLRIGEALGPHRADMHLLPDSRGLGCTVVGGRALACAAPGQPERRAGEVPFPAHRAGQRRGARQLRRLPVRAGRAVRRRRHRPGAGQPLPSAARRGDDRLGGEGLLRPARPRVRIPVRPHMLRHTAATNWVRTGVDLDVVQALPGHASLASTTVYLHARDEDKRRAVEAVAAGRRYQ